MKFINKFFFLSIAGMALLVVGTGCLKDKYADDGLAGFTINNSTKIVEIEGPVSGSAAISSSNTINLPYSTNDTVINLLTLRVAADQPVSEDVQVTVDTMQSLLKVYNDSLGTEVAVPPATVGKLQSLTATIAKGSREGFIKLTIKPSDLVNHQYGYGFKIKSVSNPAYKISGNYNTQVVVVGVKNKYDAVYSLRIKMVAGDRPTVLTGVTYDWGGDVGMITAGTNTNKLFDYYGFNAYIHPIRTSANAESAFGSTEPKFTFDLTTNKLTAVTNDFLNPANGRSFTINPAVTDSRFDPADRSIYAAFIMNQPGFGPLLIYDTLRFVRER